VWVYFLYLAQFGSVWVYFLYLAQFGLVWVYLNTFGSIWVDVGLICIILSMWVGVS